MPDREKVVMGLTVCTSEEPCNYCPYLKVRGCHLILARDALTLLKEQQKLIDEITQRRANNGAFD